MMRPDEQVDAGGDALRRYWDALDHGGTVDTGALDSAIAETVLRLRALHAGSAPAAAKARVLAHLSTDFTVPPSETRPPAGYLPSAMNGRVPMPGHTAAVRRPPVRRRQPFGLRAVAIALLALLVLGSGTWAVWPDRDRQFRTIPAASAPTPTATAVPTEQTIVDITIPAAALLPGVAGSALDINTIPPSSRATWSVPQLAHLRYLLAGTLTLRSDTPMQVLRAGSASWTAVPAAQETALVPGDAMLVLGAATIDFTNAGSDWVEMVGWILSSGMGSANPNPSVWVNQMVDLSGAGGVTLPEGAARLRLRRVLLGAGLDLPAPNGAVLVLGVPLPTNDAGTPVTVTISDQRDGSIRNYGNAVIALYVITLEPIAGGSPAASPSPS